MIKSAKSSVSDEIADYLDAMTLHWTFGNDTAVTQCRAAIGKLLREQKPLKVIVDASGFPV